MARSIFDAVRDICLSFPEAEAFTSHGAPTFRVRGGKVFAMFEANHHGSGRTALWLPAPPGSQEQNIATSKKHFFKPPYVGVRGWLGVNLDTGLSWDRVADLVREAFELVAPKRARSQLGPTIRIKPPAANAPKPVDPMETPAAKRSIAVLRKLCLDLPETSEETSFGHPVWKVGAKTFAMASDWGHGLRFTFRVGGERQAMLVEDPRYSIPPYIGHRGWVSLHVGAKVDVDELRGLVEESYRGAATKRALKAAGLL